MRYIRNKKARNKGGNIDGRKLIMASNKEMMFFVHTDFLDNIESNLEIKKEPGSDQEILEIRTAEIEIKEEFVELVAKENENFPTQKTDLALVQHKIKKPNESNLPLKEFKQDCNQSNSVVKLNSQGLLESD